MTSQLQKIILIVLKILMTLITPMILFSGIFYFNMNDVYIWYMMHSKSLFAALACFLSILVLYALAISSDVLRHDNTIQHYDTKEHHSIDENLAMKELLELYIKQQVNAQFEAKSVGKASSFDYLEHLQSLHKLKDEKSLSDEEYEKLKSLTLQKITKSLNLN